MVDPDTNTVSVNILKDGEYVATVYGDEGFAPVHVLEGCEVDLADMFDL